ncbi:galactokinase [Paraferrimonas haliotis]|uniref:galactokinase n=1 Tax=Paraferrimonas haliotis TaxID=2013866 RepID=UPI000BA9409E|nr:galactokinase [Paraferrimonas haliotis]
MSTPAQAAQALFELTYDTVPTAMFKAPGRVNLIGGHTDYNEGLVLPAAINFHTVIAVSPNSDNCINAVSARFGSEVQSWQISSEEQQDNDNDPWFNYLTGLCRSFLLTGLDIKGMNVAIASNVPLNAGLASSAALEIAFAMALSEQNGLNLSNLALAQLAQRSEYQYVGFECGLMDQMISACAQEDHAMMIDCMDMSAKPIEIPDNLSLLIFMPTQPLKRSADDYHLRQHECAQAAQHFGVESLRELTLSQLEQGKQTLSPTLYKRALHVLGENARVYDAGKALQRGQLAKFSAIMSQAHQSMRDNFELSVPQIDQLVDAINGVVGDKGGVRITGGGVGGCVVALIDHDYTEAVFSVVEGEFSKQTGVDVTTFICHPSDGVHQLAVEHS